MMNYPTFLTMVDQLCEHCEADTLRLFVHQIARTTPEENREQFLSVLSRFTDQPLEFSGTENSEEIPPEQKVDALLSKLQNIQDGNRYLESEYNEDWDDWRDNYEDQYEFMDQSGILKDVSDAVDMIHVCMDRQMYEKGAELVRALAALSIPVTGETHIDSLTLSDLNTYSLLKLDFFDITNQAIVLAYRGSDIKDRVQAMSDVMNQFETFYASLDKMLQSGREEINLSAFLPFWIEALAQKSSNTEKRLLNEAVDLLPDKTAVLEIASRYAESHPSLYLHVLENGKESREPEEMMKIGLRAMQEVPKDKEERSDIALAAASFAFAAKHPETAEMCWLEAFRSDVTVVNYLRLKLESDHFKTFAEPAREIYESLCDPYRDRVKYLGLLFYDERFEEMVAQCMKSAHNFRNSHEFCKEGTALMLNLLDQGSTGKGMITIRDLSELFCCFSVKDYCKGLDPNNADESRCTFDSCLSRWKALVSIPEDLSEFWLGWIESEIRQYVDEIMQQQRRKEYVECAAWVAAYGEVMESRGAAGEKNRIMQKYRENYSRRPAFHNALRAYGMQ